MLNHTLQVDSQEDPLININYLTSCSGGYRFSVNITDIGTIYDVIAKPNVHNKFGWRIMGPYRVSNHGVGYRQVEFTEKTLKIIGLKLDLYLKNMVIV